MPKMTMGELPPDRNNIMSIEFDFSDRRRHARFELLEYAIVRNAGSENSTRSVIVDISLGGLQLRSRTPFESGKEFELEIGRADDQPIVVIAEARESTPIEDSDLFSTGFRLTPRNALERIEWVEYVHSVFKKQGDLLTG